MEKIQTALAKARAQRDAAPKTGGAQTGGEGDGRDKTAQAQAGYLRPKEPPTPTGDPARIAAAWAALPELILDPALMQRNRIVAFEGGKDATAIDMLRTRTLQQMRD